MVDRVYLLMVIIVVKMSRKHLLKQRSKFFKIFKMVAYRCHQSKTRTQNQKSSMLLNNSRVSNPMRIASAKNTRNFLFFFLCWFDQLVDYNAVNKLTI